MPLIKKGRLVTDGFVTVGEDDALPETGGLIVSLARFKREHNEILARGEPVGVRIKAGESVAEIADDLGSLALVALEFPTFKDGRGYTSARLLRARYGYRGEIRAVGNVLRDQFGFMHRVGIDAFEVREGVTEAIWREAVSEITIVYQPSSDRIDTVFDLRRRRAARAAVAEPSYLEALA